MHGEVNSAEALQLVPSEIGLVGFLDLISPPTLNNSVLNTSKSMVNVPFIPSHHPSYSPSSFI